MSERREQLPDYEAPRVVSLSGTRVSRGQQRSCSPGQAADPDCLNGYGAASTCNPTGLAAGGGCTTGDGYTITTCATNGSAYNNISCAANGSSYYV